METIQYNNLFVYLTLNTFPPSFNSQEIAKLKRQSKFFKIKNDLLYKEPKKNPEKLLRVIKMSELEAVLFMMHNDPTAGHFSTDIMFNKIRTRYYWPQMYENIRSYVQSCDACQRRGRPKMKNELHPIPVDSPFYRIGIDFVGPLPRTSKGNKYIIVAIDYLTKWPEARAVRDATAKNVVKFLYEDIICRHGCPSKILSDRGSHFNNQLVTQLMEQFHIRHNLSTPYHPRTNGLVERFNRTLCESLAKLAEKSTQWNQYISPVLFAYRTSKQSATKIEPFYLVYGRNATLPIDNPDDLDDICTNQDFLLQDRVDHLINTLPLVRQNAKTQIQLAQQKQKKYHDKNTRISVTFNIGDKVLYFEAAKDKTHSGKLNQKWKGPYYIHQLLLNGS